MNWQDATTGANPATVAPGPADIAVLQGGAGTDEQIVGGTLGTATLHLPGNSAIEGKLTTNSLLIGSFVTPYGLPANAPAADDTDAVDVEQGWSLGGTYTSVYSNLEADGPGALLAAARFSTNKNTLSTTQSHSWIAVNRAHVGRPPLARGRAPPFAPAPCKRRCPPLRFEPADSHNFWPRATELLHNNTYATRDEAKRDQFSSVKGFYYRQRLCSALNHCTPDEAERQT